jgi:hypothetical protein
MDLLLKMFNEDNLEKMCNVNDDVNLIIGIPFALF